MSKTYLVALREYMENIRTKAFWIGILAFPVILILSFTVPMLLEKKKDVRTYAVLDESGWLLEAVEERAASPDLEKVFFAVVEKHEKRGKEFEALPETLRGLAPVLAGLEDDQIRMTASFFAAASRPEGFSKLDGADIPEAVREGIEKFHQSVREWWKALPPEEAQKYGSGLSKSRYARVDVDLSVPDPREKLNNLINEDKLFAFFVIGRDPVEGNEGCKYVSNNLTDDDLKNWFSRLATEEVRLRRIHEAGLDEEVARKIQEYLYFESKQISEEGVEEEVEGTDKVRQWAPAVFTYLLWISVFMISQMLLTNTIEEKSNRIMEVLLSSVSPLELMSGKIVGIASTGLTMVISWVVFFIAGIKLMPFFFDQMPDFDLAQIVRDPVYIASFLIYFVLGYLLLASIFVGIGSVCNSLKEAQNLMSPVTIIMIVPLFAMVPVVRDPNGTIAKVLSYIPPFTPFVMMNRAAGPPTTAEYVATTALLAVSIIFVLWAAAKVFRIGILMTGKPPKFLEIMRWIRTPVGQVHVKQEDS